MRRSAGPGSPTGRRLQRPAPGQPFSGHRRTGRTGCRRNSSPTRTSSLSHGERTHLTLLPRRSATGRERRRRVRLRRTAAGAATIWLLAALLHVRPNELLGVLLEHLVDLVEDGVHVVGELFVPLLDFLCTASLGLFGLFGAPRGLPLTACVLRCHMTTSVSPNAIVTRGSPAQSRQPEIGTNSLHTRGASPPASPPGRRGLVRRQKGAQQGGATGG